jgi:hypothetical protein
MANNYVQATVEPSLPASLFTEAELQSLSFACGLYAERCDDLLYFYAEDSFCEIHDDEDGTRISGPELLQEKLRQLDPVEYPRIVVEGATCSKMRSGEFGGFAFVITRDEIRWMSTWEWIHQQQAVA